MTITTLATDQVHVLLDHTIAHALHLDGNVENANNGDDHPVRSSIPSLLEAMSRRRDIRKNKEQIVTPILSSFSQVQTQYSDSQTFEVLSFYSFILFISSLLLFIEVFDLPNINSYRRARSWQLEDDI